MTSNLYPSKMSLTSSPRGMSFMECIFSSVTRAESYRSRILTEVADLYTWLDEQITANIDPNKECKCCGACCDFDTFDHRLYLTTPELIYFQAQQQHPLKEMTTGRCPYNENGQCTVYSTRFVGCRIFGCTRTEDLHTYLSETALTKLKAICKKYNIPYRYLDLKTALSQSDSMTV